MKIFGQAGEGLLPIFQQSASEFRQNIELARRYGVMNEKGAEASARLQKAQTELELAVRGFGFSIAEAVEPALTPVIHQMAEWIAANRKWIAQDIAGYVRQVVKWLKDGGWDQIKNGVLGVMHSISDVVDYLGGWRKAAQDAAIGMGALWGVSVLAKIALLTAALSGVAGALTAIGVAGGVAAAAAMTYDVSKTGWIGDWLSKHTDHFGKSYEDQEADHRAASMLHLKKWRQAERYRRFFRGMASQRIRRLVWSQTLMLKAGLTQIFRATRSTVNIPLTVLGSGINPARMISAALWGGISVVHLLRTS